MQYERYEKEMKEAEQSALKGDPINTLAAVWLAWRQADLPANAKEQARKVMALANLLNCKTACPIEIDQAMQNLEKTRSAAALAAAFLFEPIVLEKIY